MVRLVFLLGLMIPLSSCKTQLLEEQTDESDYDIVMRTNGFTLDELGYLYVISSRNELMRYDPNLVMQFAYSNERLGRLTSVDANNPLKLLLFYENYQTIILLDNLLGEIGRYELFDLGYNDINAVGISNDNNIWIYDPIVYKLKKIDKSGGLLTESITMYNEGLEYIRPGFLVEKGNKVFLYDEAYGFFVFDNLGQYLFNIPIKGLKSYQILSENKIIFLEDDKIQTYDLIYKTAEMFRSIKGFTKLDIEDVLISKRYVFLKNERGIVRKNI